jgi:hypothetical protein
MGGFYRLALYKYGEYGSGLDDGFKVISPGQQISI